MENKIGKKEQFLDYINNFRGFAMILIVAIHMYHPLQHSDPIAYDILNVIFLNSSVVFVFISGFLFQHLLRKYEYQSFLKKKFLFIILPYFIMSVPALMLTLLHLPYAENHLADTNWDGYSIISKIALLLVTGAHQAQLWFIPMIALMFLFSIILKYIDENPKLYLLLPILLSAAVLLGRQNYKPLYLFVYFLPVYMFGMLISRYKNQIFERLNMVYSMLLLLSFVVLSVLAHYTENHTFYLFQKLIMAVLVMIFLRKFPHFLNRFFGVIADYSFGIYFVHLYAYFVITHIAHWLSMGILLEGIFGFFFKLVSVLLISMGFIKIVRLLFKKKSRYIIGC